MNDAALESALQDLWQHLTSDRQAWLLGAGVSFDAGIPLMFPLTKYVRTLVREKDMKAHDLLESIIKQLPDSYHIEHVLSQLGDLIALAERSRNKAMPVDGEDVSVSDLLALHRDIVDHIGHAVRYGYKPPQGSEPERRGSQCEPIVEVAGHRQFVRHLFAARVKPGIGQRPITFFTTNYDTLIEDALALEHIPCVDGFLGGAMAFWSPEVAYSTLHGQAGARIIKLHGSVDWHRMEDGALVRCRAGCGYPDRAGNLMIYPQSTKYVATQRDPFASLFAQFRSSLAVNPDNVLGVCGYSFGDDHVNDEIEAAMTRPGSKTVLIAFSGEVWDGGARHLPTQLQAWLGERIWSDRVFVASASGLYHGSLVNLLPKGAAMDWWTFNGLTRYLAEGPEFVPVTAIDPTSKDPPHMVEGQVGSVAL